MKSIIWAESTFGDGGVPVQDIVPDDIILYKIEKKYKNSLQELFCSDGFFWVDDMGEFFLNDDVAKFYMGDDLGDTDDEKPVLPEHTKHSLYAWNGDEIIDIPYNAKFTVFRRVEVPDEENNNEIE